MSKVTYCSMICTYLLFKTVIKIETESEFKFKFNIKTDITYQIYSKTQNLPTIEIDIFIIYIN